MKSVPGFTGCIFRALLVAGALGWVTPVPAGTEDWVVEVLAGAGAVRGANGMQFDADGQLIAGSMSSGTVFGVDRRTGAITPMVPSPRGIADDLAIGPDGTIVWSTMPLGIVHVLRPGGRVEELVRNLPFVNALYFGPGGRLYASQVTTDKGGLWELDMAGAKPPRLVVADLPGLNGFEITRENILYGPLMHTGAIVRIDLDTGEVSEIASGFARPTAVNLDSRGRLYVVDYLTGEVTRIDPANGRRTVVGRSAPPIDNLAVSADDLIYLSHPCENGIEELDPETGRLRIVARGSLGQPGSLTLARRNGRDALLVAGLFCQFYVDPDTGAIERMPRSGDPAWSGDVAVGPNAVAITSFAFGELQLLDPQTGEPLDTRRALKSPYGVRFEDNGDLVVAEYASGRLLRFPAQRGGRRLAAEPVVEFEELTTPVDFIPAGGDAYYVSEAEAGRISRANPATGERTTVLEGLKGPEGLAMLPDGRLIVAEVGRKRLIAFRPPAADSAAPVAAPVADASLEVIAEGIPIGLPPFMGPPKAFTPTGVVVDGRGRIFVSSDVDVSVLRITEKSAASR